MTIATTQTANVEDMERVIASGKKLDLRYQMENIFFPIVKDGQLENFQKVWQDWLVLSDAVEEQKCPGKLKPEFCSFNGEMICLAPKSYFAYCRTRDKSKDGRKGIPKYHQLTKDIFYDVLYDDTMPRHVTQVNSLRLNRDKEMTRTSTRKRGLTAVHVKMSVGPDRITCGPLKCKNEYVW